jgi:hypothetical protein
VVLVFLIDGLMVSRSLRWRSQHGAIRRASRCSGNGARSERGDIRVAAGERTTSPALSKLSQIDHMQSMGRWDNFRPQRGAARVGDRNGKITADSRRQRAASGAQGAAMSEEEEKELAKRPLSWEEVRRLMVAPSTGAPASGLMSSTPSSIQSNPAPRRRAIAGPIEEPVDSSFPLANDDLLPSERPLGKRARALSRFLITFCIGVAATLAWQSYGGTAREIIANSSPQLSWLAPPAAPVAEASGLAPPAAPVAEASAAPSPDQEELKGIWFGLAGVRQRVDEIAAQLAAGQEQVTRDINNLKAVEQDILDKISAPPPRPAAPARKSVPLTPLPLTPLPLTPPEAQPAR